MDALGGGRATGSGRVRLSLAETMASPRPVRNPTGRLVLLLRNLDPLCITATATPDNLIPSFAFVPGRALLGAFANWLIAEGHKNAAKLLVDGLVSVSDALPVPYAPKKLAEADALPAPLSLQSEKPAGSEGPIPWWAEASAVPWRLDSHSPAAQGLGLKRPEHDLFVYRGAPTDPWIAHRPQLRVRLRNGRPDPNQADPSLFAIEQIVEDTLFLCELRGTPEHMRRLAADLKPILEGSRWLRIGRAGAPVEVAQLEWPGAPTRSVGSPSAILTLTSDLLDSRRTVALAHSTRRRELSSNPELACECSPVPGQARSSAGHSGCCRRPWLQRNVAALANAGLRGSARLRVQGGGRRCGRACTHGGRWAMARRKDARRLRTIPPR